MSRYCANLKAIRYESTSLNRIVADKSHRVIVALLDLLHHHKFYALKVVPDHVNDISVQTKRSDLSSFGQWKVLKMAFFFCLSCYLL